MSVFGRIVTNFDVEEAVRENLELWLPSYMAEVARQHSIDPSKLVAPRKPYAIRSRFQQITSADLPLVAIMSAGLGGPPERRGDGAHTASWAVGVGTVFEAPGDTARELAGIAGAAIRALMVQHSEQGGIDVDDTPGIATSTIWVDERYDDLRPGEEGDRASARMMFLVTIDNVVNEKGGPRDVPTDPDAPVADWPTAQPGKISTTIDRED